MMSSGMKLHAICLLSVLFSLLALSRSATALRSNLMSQLPGSDVDPFLEMAKYLSKNRKEEELGSYTVEEIARALGSLAAAQVAMKSMDGATHQLRNTFKSSTSLGSRYEKFVKSRSRNTKEAAKIFEYIQTVERGLQACEIVQSVSKRDGKTRKQWLKFAGLQEITRFQITENKVSCTIAVLVPLPTDTQTNRLENEEERYEGEEVEKSAPSAEPRFDRGELVLAVVDDVRNDATSVAQILRLMTRERPAPVKVLCDDLGNITLSIQPTFLTIAIKAAQQLQDLTASLSIYYPSVPTTFNDSANVTYSSPPLPTSIRIIGHSSGAAVGSYLALILDGALCSDHLLPTPSQRLHWAGKYHRQIKCLTLGCPPCLTREVVPKFITSIVCGDDIVPRARSDALANFAQRVIKALQAGAGRKGMSWLATPALVKDVSAMAGKSLERRKVSKKSSNILGVPGRVFFIKSRQLKQGATIQRILKGNWQEEVLWNIHDVLISAKMLEHHSGESNLEETKRQNQEAEVKIDVLH